MAESQGSFKPRPRQQLGPHDSNFLTKHVIIFCSSETFACFFRQRNPAQISEIKKSCTSGVSWGAQKHSQISAFSFSSQLLKFVSELPFQQLRGKLRENKSISACFSTIVRFSFLSCTCVTTFQNKDKNNLVLNNHGHLNYDRAQMWKLQRCLSLLALSSDSLACCFSPL